MRAILTACFIVFLTSSCVLGQQEKVADLDSASSSSGKCSYSDPKTNDACNKAEQAKFLYHAASYNNASSTFAWSLTANIIIFAVVVLLVLSGLVFAAIQFRIAFHHGTQVVADANTAMATNMEIDTHGIKVNSSILGVIVLLISMAFFYLYAIYIYPVQVVQPDKMKVLQDQRK